MTEASRELLQAVYGLRKAAEAEFKGNAYYQVTNEIGGLLDLIGWGGGDIEPGKDASYGFASMLAEVRNCALASTSGNQFYLIQHKLDALASYLTPAAQEAPKTAEASAKPAAAVSAEAQQPAETAMPAAAPASSAAAEAPAAPRPSFADLSAASKARADDVAASLGIATVHHAAPAEAEAAPAEVLEPRSSEPCAMAELAPVEPVAAAPAEAAPHAASPSEEIDLTADLRSLCPFAHAFAGAETPGEQPAAAHDGEASAAHGKAETFSEIAAASSARAEQVAADLGVHAAHPAPAAEAPSERRLESRSSADLRQDLEPVQPANVSAKADPDPAPSEAAFDLGSPAAQGDGEFEESVLEDIAAAQEAAQPAVEPQAPAPEEAPAPSASAAVVEEVVIVETAAAEAPQPAAEPQAPAPEEAPAPSVSAVVVEEVILIEAVAVEAPQPAAEPQAPAPEEAPAPSISAAVVEEAVLTEAAAVEAPQPAAEPQAPAPEEAPAPSASAVVVEEVVIVEAVTVEAPQAAAHEEAPVPPAPPLEAAPGSAEPAAELKKPKKTLFKLWLDLAFGRKD